MAYELKKGKKGWMKIFEASIAITLIMGFMVLVYSQTIERPPAGESLVRWQTSVLDELKKRPDLRQEILSNPTTVCDPTAGGPVYGFILKRITKAFPGFGFSCRVCDPGKICGIESYHKEVYSEEKIIAATLTTFSPKKIKLFVWPLEPGEELFVPPTVPPAAPPGADTMAPGSVTLTCTPTAGNPATIRCDWNEPTDDISGFAKSIVYVNDAAQPEIPKAQAETITLQVSDTTQRVIRVEVYDVAGNKNSNAGTRTCTARYMAGNYNPFCN